MLSRSGKRAHTSRRSWGYTVESGLSLCVGQEDERDPFEGRVDGLYLVLISLHGLVRGERMELGKDPDTGGQVRCRGRPWPRPTPAASVLHSCPKKTSWAAACPMATMPDDGCVLLAYILQ